MSIHHFPSKSGKGVKSLVRKHHPNRSSLLRRLLVSFFLLSSDVLLLLYQKSLLLSEASTVAGSEDANNDVDNSGDSVEDSIFDPLQADPDCTVNPDNNKSDGEGEGCWSPPKSTIEEVEVEVIEEQQVPTTTQAVIDATCAYGGNDPDEGEDEGENRQQNSAGEIAASSSDSKGYIDNRTCKAGSTQQDPFNKQTTQTTSTATTTTTTTTKKIVDKHWGSDPHILRMRNKLRLSGTGASQKYNQKHGLKNGKNERPPIFLMPGLASTRLVAWRFKACPHILSDINVQDNVWLNINLIMQMGTIDVTCMRECLQLGMNQSDTDDLETGCKIRPDEGLDAISSLSPGGIGSTLMGGTNTVYAWLVQWLADNLGYDVSNVVGLPYDWRLSPDKTEERDGFLTLTRRRIEAAVQSNGQPGIMVAHSMGNTVFRYFLEWLRMRLREEAYDRYIKLAERRAKAIQNKAAGLYAQDNDPDDLTADSTSSFLPGWMSGVVPDFDDWWSATYAPDTIRTHQEQKHNQLWELAQLEGDDNWVEWIETHLWTYVGLSAPMLGAVNPLRAVLSGENMGLPLTDEDARHMEVTFGSTHTVNPIASKEGFCDQWNPERWDEEPSKSKRHADARLACLDDIYTEIEYSSDHNVRDPWANFTALRAFLKERRDWDSDFPMIEVVEESCRHKEKSPCSKNSTLRLGPKDVQTGEVFSQFSRIWKEKDDPLLIKRDQLRESFWDSKVTNILNRTWERPLIKHVIMAYGVDIPTEVAYMYRKTNRVEKVSQSSSMGDEVYDGVPIMERVLWEMPGGRLEEERFAPRGSLTDLITKKKPKRSNKRQGNLQHSGDGSVPYLSLSWAHTWLLHSVRALRHSGREDGPENPLDAIQISHRPKGAMEWEDGPPPERYATIDENKKVEESTDTGTAHPHGTKYKPEMVRYHNRGLSRTTGIEYTTTVIEAIGVEHKETTRNYDILAGVFTDVLRFLHEDSQV